MLTIRWGAPLKNRLIGTCSRSIHDGVFGGVVFLSCPNGSLNEDLLECFPELPGHATIDGKVDGVADDKGKIGEQHKEISDSIIEELNNG